MNHAELLTRTYERFLENQIRSEFPMEGLPFVFEVRSRVSEKRGSRKSSGNVSAGTDPQVKEAKTAPRKTIRSPGKTTGKTTGKGPRKATQARSSSRKRRAN